MILIGFDVLLLVLCVILKRKPKERIPKDRIAGGNLWEDAERCFGSPNDISEQPQT